MASIFAAAFVAAFAIVHATPVSAATPKPLACSAQPSSLRLCNVRTDNYKDCYNAPDDQRELRSWLPFTHVRAQGARWNLIPGQQEFLDTVRVRRVTSVRGRRLPRTAFLTVKPVTASQVTSIDYRIGDPATMFGPLVTFSEAVTSDAPVAIVASLARSNGALLGRTTATYRYDSVLAAAPLGSIEGNGPGGRWFVGKRRTLTDWELGSGAMC